MTRTSLLPLVLVLAGCAPKDAAPPGNDDPGPRDTTVSLTDARKGFATTLARRHRSGDPVPAPPGKVFRQVKYDSPAGTLAAYVTPDPGDRRKRPAIVWITGGDCNTIGDVWTPGAAKNDQSARQYREAGIVMMFPSLRGGNDNPGVQEHFLGEVDDVLAAADYLAKQPHVDPDRIYLGGHSTGGTLAMLVAASTDRFRAVFSFGPTDTIDHYDAEYIPGVNTADAREVEFRSPANWLHSVGCPTFVFEGETGNVLSLMVMAKASTNPHLRFFPVKGVGHFDILAPTNRLIAKKILGDSGAVTNIAFTSAELDNPGRK